MADTDALTDLEIVALTLIGESEDLGEEGMTGTALTLQNRAKANLHWMGGSTLRGVCLQKSQYDCWWPETNNSDRERIILIAQNNPLYGPYVLAQRIARDVMSGNLADYTNGAVSYVDPPAEPDIHPGNIPCYIEGARRYYDLKAVV